MRENQSSIGPRGRQSATYYVLLIAVGSAIGIPFGYLLTHWLFSGFSNANMLTFTENILTVIITALTIIAALVLSGLWTDFEQRQQRHAEELTKKLTENFIKENMLALEQREKELEQKLEKKGDEIKKDSKAYLWYGVGACFTFSAALLGRRAWIEWKKTKGNH